MAMDVSSLVNVPGMSGPLSTFSRASMLPSSPVASTQPTENQTMDKILPILQILGLITSGIAAGKGRKKTQGNPPAQNLPGIGSTERGRSLTIPAYEPESPLSAIASRFPQVVSQIMEQRIAMKKAEAKEATKSSSDMVKTMIKAYENGSIDRATLQSALDNYRTISRLEIDLHASDVPEKTAQAKLGTEAARTEAAKATTELRTAQTGQVGKPKPISKEDKELKEAQTALAKARTIAASADKTNVKPLTNNERYNLLMKWGVLVDPHPTPDQDAQLVAAQKKGIQPSKHDTFKMLVSAMQGIGEDDPAIIAMYEKAKKDLYVTTSPEQNSAMAKAIETNANEIHRAYPNKQAYEAFLAGKGYDLSDSGIKSVLDRLWPKKKR